MHCDVCKTYNLRVYHKVDGRMMCKECKKSFKDITRRLEMLQEDEIFINKRISDLEALLSLRDYVTMYPGLEEKVTNELGLLRLIKQRGKVSDDN